MALLVGRVGGADQCLLPCGASTGSHGARRRQERRTSSQLAGVVRVRGADFWIANKEKGIGEVAYVSTTPAPPTDFRERTVEKESCHTVRAHNPLQWTSGRRPSRELPCRAGGGCTRGSGQAVCMGGSGTCALGVSAGEGTHPQPARGAFS